MALCNLIMIYAFHLKRIKILDNLKRWFPYRCDILSLLYYEKGNIKASLIIILIMNIYFIVFKLLW